MSHDIEHFVIYSTTGLAFGLGYGRTRSSLAFMLMLFSGAVEIAQLFIPGRHARLSDFLVDVMATSFGVLMSLPISRSRPYRSTAKR